MSDLVRLTLWFMGPNGPVSDTSSYTSRAVVERMVEDNPYCLGIQVPGEDLPEKVKAYYEREATNV